MWLIVSLHDICSDLWAVFDGFDGLILQRDAAFRKHLIIDAKEYPKERKRKLLAKRWNAIKTLFGNNLNATSSIYHLINIRWKSFYEKELWKT